MSADIFFNVITREGECYWHPGGGGQRCCQTLYNAQDRPPKNALVPSLRNSYLSLTSNEATKGTRLWPQSPHQAPYSPYSSPARHPPAFGAAPGERKPQRRGGARSRRKRWSRCSRRRRRLYRSFGPVRPLLPHSPPPPSWGRPTQHPQPSAHIHPHPPRQAHYPTRGAPPRALRPRTRGSRAGEPAGPAKATPSGCSGRGGRGRSSRLSAPQARPPRHRKCRRRGSPHIQFKLSLPPPPLPPGLPPPPRPGPAVAPAPPPFATAPRLASGRSPRPVRGPRSPPASRAADPSRDGPKLRLTHGAAVDAPLLSSSGSRTDRHPLPPPRPARAQRSPRILQSRLRRFRGVAARRRCSGYAGDSRRTPPLALDRLLLPPPPLRPLRPGFRAERRLASISRDYFFAAPPTCSFFEHDFIGFSGALLVGFSRHVKIGGIWHLRSHGQSGVFLQHCP
ncbi:uncharacterized protein LOC130851863 [Hippopotamus amphibius kiboko]|uniref:uncharacterized protein LOC130851863 n=1 Tax=Hippopotamus amphibius kiboko TaxID=575201 RepID=UPI0025960AC7|nr:uncharacterized protein LOC130851863 [Hippopotamus amphibius kiboko]